MIFQVYWFLKIFFTPLQVWKNFIAPYRFPWSVTAIDVIPISFAFAIIGSTFESPSKSENSE